MVAAEAAGYNHWTRKISREKPSDIRAVDARKCDVGSATAVGTVDVDGLRGIGREGV